MKWIISNMFKHLLHYKVVDVATRWSFSPHRWAPGKEYSAYVILKETVSGIERSSADEFQTRRIFDPEKRSAVMLNIELSLP